jgi:4-deoxy-L-threo-5-hexosulose-uronate ketol-isomerase
MQEDAINFVYTHYDRYIVGGVVPVKEKIQLGTYEPIKSEYFLERRELGIINVGGSGYINVDGEQYHGRFRFKTEPSDLFYEGYKFLIIS